eukprot:comp54223_c0_seq1/m.47748 comp54223_c0_seq1/g.47748  ORF comp54223_c0_seq1/g.47748 comp54223_c0_seq1/m.47748 type:complete len:301 (-) comp54223_c0_seq1:500-1402(-)
MHMKAILKTIFRQLHHNQPYPARLLPSAQTSSPRDKHRPQLQRRAEIQVGQLQRSRRVQAERESQHVQSVLVRRRGISWESLSHSYSVLRATAECTPRASTLIHSLCPSSKHTTGSVLTASCALSARIRGRRTSFYFVMSVIEATTLSASDSRTSQADAGSVISVGSVHRAGRRPRGREMQNGDTSIQEPKKERSQNSSKHSVWPVQSSSASATSAPYVLKCTGPPRMIFLWCAVTSVIDGYISGATTLMKPRMKRWQKVPSLTFAVCAGGRWQTAHKSGIYMILGHVIFYVPVLVGWLM